MMNVSEEVMKEYHYPVHFGMNKNYLTRIFGQTETLCSFETHQFEDYNNVVFNYFDPEESRDRRKTVFRKIAEKAFELGARLAGTVASTPTKS